jgi:hypothetical protein
LLNFHQNSAVFTERINLMFWKSSQWSKGLSFRVTPLIKVFIFIIRYHFSVLIWFLLKRFLAKDNLNLLNFIKSFLIIFNFFWLGTKKIYQVLSNIIGILWFALINVIHYTINLYVFLAQSTFTRQLGTCIFMVVIIVGVLIAQRTDLPCDFAFRFEVFD